MAIPHARAGEIIDIRPLGAALATTPTKTLVKTDTLQVLRLVVPAGKEIAEHRALGEITVQCIEGRVAFSAHDTTVELQPGQMLYLAANEPHAVRGVEDSSLLLTLLLPEKPQGSA